MEESGGLELRVWAVEDQDALIAEAIGNYKGRPTPMLDSEHGGGQRALADRCRSMADQRAVGCV